MARPVFRSIYIKRGKTVRGKKNQLITFFCAYFSTGDLPALKEICKDESINWADWWISDIIPNAFHRMYGQKPAHNRINAYCYDGTTFVSFEGSYEEKKGGVLQCFMNKDVSHKHLLIDWGDGQQALEIFNNSFQNESDDNNGESSAVDESSDEGESSAVDESSDEGKSSVEGKSGWKKKIEEESLRRQNEESLRRQKDAEQRELDVLKQQQIELTEKVRLLQERAKQRQDFLKKKEELTQEVEKLNETVSALEKASDGAWSD